MMLYVICIHIHIASPVTVTKNVVSNSTFDPLQKSIQMVSCVVIEYTIYGSHG